ncbi:Membrane protein involved in the export of O-antigen and teichoic acid [Klenkia marina]|uniref:Membrane protein involved in the export of O-antigen and teichoic acid n=1 Tax=Klenkia marina TaxID=1960309 RepID=A0A1G4YE59_9ACTN|nr:hypothetical protein [Klenkia marina]SCX51703.1 Membrane protein involved in the export of O-antigen and teichoic acid [Klenkia marina]
MVVCIAGASVLTYGYLAVVARNLPSAEYAGFGSFWSLALIVAFGVFLPVELELARAMSAHPDGDVPARLGRTVLWLVLGCLAAIAATSPFLVPALGGSSTLAPLAALVVVSAGQFLLRGMLLGQGRLVAHGTVLLVDSGLRVLLAWLVGVVVPDAGSAVYAWTTVIAVALAHLPLLVLVGRRAGRGGTPPGPALAGPRGGTGASRMGAAVTHLLVGTLSAQVLLNSGPVLASAVAGATQAGVAAAYVACFTLVRLPLFVAVPLQSALVPLLVSAARAGGPRAVRAVVLRMIAGTAAAASLGWVIGDLIGPPLVGLLFGDEYRLPGSTIALLAAGAGLHIGLIVLTQVLVATEQHRRVALVWSTGVAVGLVVFLAVPDLVLRAGLGFTLGTAAALLACTVFLVRGGLTDLPAEPPPRVG